MKTLLATMLGATLMFGATVVTAEPVRLTASQMDNITAGRVTPHQLNRDFGIPLRESGMYEGWFLVSVYEDQFGNSAEIHMGPRGAAVTVLYTHEGGEVLATQQHPNGLDRWAPLSGYSSR